MVFESFIPSPLMVFGGINNLAAMEFQWFSIVDKHWSNDGMVTIHRRSLTLFNNFLSGNFNSTETTQQLKKKHVELNNLAFKAW